MPPVILKNDLRQQLIYIEAGRKSSKTTGFILSL